MNGTIPGQRHEAQAHEDAGRVRSRVLFIVDQADRALTATEVQELYSLAFGDDVTVDAVLADLQRSRYVEVQPSGFRATDLGAAWAAIQR